MKTIGTKQTSLLLGTIALVAIVTLSSHAYAQENPAGVGQQNGIPLGAPYGTGGQETSTAGSDAMVGWSTGIVVIGIMTGVGVWSAVRKH